MSADAIRAALRVRYPTGEYAVLFEVGKSTGFGNGGWADAIAMSLWPSRGLMLHGFEIKISRGDWLRELKNPAKAEDFCGMCDYWWIVATAGIVKAEELPPTWGLLEHKNGKLFQTVTAPKLPGCGDIFKRSFVAAMLRRASDGDAGEIRSRVDAEVAKRLQDQEALIAHYAERRTHDAGELLKRAEAIKAATGIDLSGWQPTEDIAAAIKFALSGGIFKKYGGLRSLAKQLEESAQEIHRALESTPAALNGTTAGRGSQETREPNNQDASPSPVVVVQQDHKE